MNKILTGALLLLFSSSAAAQTPRDSIAFATAQWRTADLGGGAECRYAQIDMFGSRQSISVATYPGRRFTTSIVHLDRRAESTSDLGKAAGAEIAVNGSYFNVKTFEPVTFVLLDRKIVGRTTPEEAFRTNGVIAFNTPSVEDGFKFENIVLTFENGKCVDAKANNTKKLTARRIFCE